MKSVDDVGSNLFEQCLLSRNHVRINSHLHCLTYWLWVCRDTLFLMAKKTNLRRMLNFLFITSWERKNDKQQTHFKESVSAGDN